MNTVYKIIRVKYTGGFADSELRKEGLIIGNEYTGEQEPGTDKVWIDQCIVYLGTNAEIVN